VILRSEGSGPTGRAYIEDWWDIKFSSGDISAHAYLSTSSPVIFHVKAGQLFTGCSLGTLCSGRASNLEKRFFFFHLMCAYTPLNVLFHYVVSDTKSMTDHPYRDQIPVFTRPLIGNYYDPYDIAPVTRGLTRSTGRARVPPHLMLA
jgi:hypothetical protein